MAADQHELSAVAPAGSREPALVHAHAVDERRSPRWEGTRRAFLAKWPQCAVCGHDALHAPGALNVHHVVPFQASMAARS
jgi:5-methylcytosine-specific restriction endonuclease McrA